MGLRETVPFNEQVRDKVDTATSVQQQTPTDVEKVCILFQEGEKLNNLRQKNILIADRSEHGWATVAEYEEDELADNSDEEKRVFRVEVRAGRKLKQKGAKEASKKGGPLGNPLGAPGRALPHGLGSMLKIAVLQQCHSHLACSQWSLNC